MHFCVELFRNSTQNSDDEDIDVVEEDEEEEDDDEEDNGSRDNIQASVLENCFQAMVDTLAKQVLFIKFCFYMFFLMHLQNK